MRNEDINNTFSKNVTCKRVDKSPVSSRNVENEKI